MSVNKNGNLIVNSSVISKMNVKQLSDGSKWARIYFLDVSNTKTFFCLFCKKNYIWFKNGLNTSSFIG